MLSRGCIGGKITHTHTHTHTGNGEMGDRGGGEDGDGEDSDEDEQDEDMSQLPLLDDDEKDLVKRTIAAMKQAGLDAPVSTDAHFVYCETTGITTSVGMAWRGVAWRGVMK